MSNVVAAIIGFVSLVLVAVAFLPLLGWANWLILPVAIVGAGIGQLSAGSKTGRNICILAIIVGALRLMLGGGII